VSVLLAGLGPELAAAVTRRLLGQGDQVRVIARPGQQGPPGAHVATGDLSDEDLVERACQGVRTVVVGEAAAEDRASALAAAARAGVDRAVFVGAAPDCDVPSGMTWVALVLPRARLLGRRKAPGADAVAEAVDAADDLAGEPRLVADLGTDEGWRALRLDPPA
jgi:hypothetical protein